jgi:hypothetical protein
MATYSVTGTYSYRAGSWYDGSGQAPGATIEAETARDAAETYRETVVVPLLADKGGFKPVSNVCAVAIDGDAETYSDPLEGLATPSASRLAMLRSMRVADLRAFAAEPFRYGLGSQPAIRTPCTPGGSPHGPTGRTGHSGAGRSSAPEGGAPSGGLAPASGRPPSDRAI